MWNTYRQCQLHLADLICRINNSVRAKARVSHGKTENTKLRSEIDDYISDIIASLPFMLAGELICHCKPNGASWLLPKPPMLLGGLSMQWRLFTIATLETASPASKAHAREVLLWLAETLGLGQAKVLASVGDLLAPHQSEWLTFGRCKIIRGSLRRAMHFRGQDFWSKPQDGCNAATQLIKRSRDIGDRHA